MFWVVVVVVGTDVVYVLNSVKVEMVVYVLRCHSVIVKLLS
jgi:hypothetical protein